MINRILKLESGVLVWSFLAFFVLFLFFLLSPKAADKVEISLVGKLSVKEDIHTVSEKFGLGNINQVFPFSDNPELGNYYRLSFSGTQPGLDRLMAAPEFDFIEKDTAVQTSIITVNDPAFTTSVTDQEKQWWLSLVKVPEAWEIDKGSGKINVAVVDTGINGQHEDLSDGRVGAGYLSYCQVASPSSGTCLVHVDGTVPGSVNSDDNGHGTIVAGIIGAISDNSKGIAGVAHSVRLMPVKVMDSTGQGVSSDVAAGIVWATDNGADIINMSLGGTSLIGNAVLANAITYAFERNVLIVAASGNDSALVGADLDIDPVYPVCADNGQNMVLGVAATDIDDKKASFSNFGRSCVDIIAPGTAFFNSKSDQKGIISTYYDPEMPTRNNIYVFASGTSMAAPIVTGVAILLKSALPDLSNTALRDRIIASVDTVDALSPTACLGDSCAGRMGSGRINAQKALQAPTFTTFNFLRDSIGRIYRIEDGVRRLVSGFVFEQRNFDENKIDEVGAAELELVPLGQSLPPLDGTLVKARNNATIYLIDGEVLLPVSLLAFRSSGYRFEDVSGLPGGEIGGYRKGPNLPPRNGALLKLFGEPSVYYLHEGERRLISFFSFQNRFLDFANVVDVGIEEFERFPEDSTTKLQPPLDGTLIKSDSDQTVYVVESGRSRALAARAFAERNYQFGDIFVLTQSEMDGYLKGLPIL